MARRNEGWLELCDIIEAYGLFCYDVAAEIGITRYTFSVWLHEKPTIKRIESVKQAIKSLIEKRPAFNLEKKKIMKPEEFLQEMKIIFMNKRDTAQDHSAADSLMCEVLTQLGYGDGVRVFEEADKWYL